MKHARPEQLNGISIHISNHLRQIKGIKEKSPFHFYYRGKNILHFHEMRGDIYADILNTRIRCLSNYEELARELDKCVAKIDNLKNSSP